MIEAVFLRLSDWVQGVEEGSEEPLSITFTVGGADYEMWIVAEPKDRAEVIVGLPYPLPISEGRAQALLEDMKNTLGGSLNFLFYPRSQRVSAITRMFRRDLPDCAEPFICLCESIAQVFDHAARQGGEWDKRLLALATHTRDKETTFH